MDTIFNDECSVRGKFSPSLQGIAVLGKDVTVVHPCHTIGHIPWSYVVLLWTSGCAY